MDKELKQYLDNQRKYFDQKFARIDQRFDGVDQRLETVERIQLRLENFTKDRFDALADLADVDTSGSTRKSIDDCRLPW